MIRLFDRIEASGSPACQKNGPKKVMCQKTLSYKTKVFTSNGRQFYKTEDFLLKILGFQCHMSSFCGCQFSFSSLVVVNTSGTSSDFNAGLHGAAGSMFVFVGGMTVNFRADEDLDRLLEKA